jgi:hypothetical protein
MTRIEIQTSRIDTLLKEQLKNNSKMPSLRKTRLNSNIKI